MSGVVGAISAIGSAVSVLFGGGGDVTIGSVTLQGNSHEVPDSLTWGGKQRVAAHELPGGDVVLHPMGTTWPPIRWSGRFLQANAQGRAQQLDQIRQQGDEVQLTWLNHNYVVIVTDFECKDLSTSWAEYTIECRVRDDLSTSGTDSTPSLLDSVTQDVQDATGIALPSMTQVTSALATAQQVLTPLNAITGGALANVQGALQGAQAATSLATAAASGSVSTFAALGAAASVVFPPGSVITKGPALVAAAGTLAAGVQVGGYVGRAVKNCASGSP